MASSNDASRAGARSTSPADDMPSFPQFPGRSADYTGPPSIISSRMTDIASDDGGEPDEPRSGSPRKSGMASDTLSRPGTAKTGMSSLRNQWGQGGQLRKGISAISTTQRRSIGASSTAGSTMSGRPPSATTRSHIPSVTSNAFFRPMSSQRLQAQRGVNRPTTKGRQHALAESESSAPAVEDFAHQSVVSQPTSIPVSNPVARIAQPLSEDGEVRPPPSRGSQMTEQETLDRITANTSPTHGHYPAASLSESVRPLQKKKVAEGKGLTLKVDNGLKSGANVPTPIKSPRSFRSSFLLPTKGSSAREGSTNRNIQGGEKLDSVASTPRLSPSVPAPHHSEGHHEGLALRLGRNFEYFEGNTVFSLGGRVQNTRSRPINVATGLVIVIPCILFFVFSAPWHWFNTSPAIPIVFGYLFFLCMSSFIHASASDPGILPRNLHRFPPPDPDEDPLRLGPPTTDWTLVKSAVSKTSAMEVPTKYCKTCNIWRPPRAHHCRLCDNCIETADHHCVWINNCVGRRNYRYFFAFLITLSLLCLFLLVASLAQIIVHMNRQGVSFGTSIDTFRVPFALVIYAILGILYPLALLGYHIFLIARGETTREFLTSHKFQKQDRYRAFTQRNWVWNWIAVLCRPRGPTYYRFKDQYEKGDQRLAAERRLRGKADPKDGLEMQDVKPSRPAGVEV